MRADEACWENCSKADHKVSQYLHIADKVLQGSVCQVFAHTRPHCFSMELALCTGVKTGKRLPQTGARNLKAHYRLKYH